jgi:hypothetical protein
MAEDTAYSCFLIAIIFLATMISLTVVSFLIGPVLSEIPVLMDAEIGSAWSGTRRALGGGDHEGEFPGPRVSVPRDGGRGRRPRMRCR